GVVGRRADHAGRRGGQGRGRRGPGRGGRGRPLAVARPARRCPRADARSRRPRAPGALRGAAQRDLRGAGQRPACPGEPRLRPPAPRGRGQGPALRPRRPRGHRRRAGALRRHPAGQAPGDVARGARLRGERALARALRPGVRGALRAARRAPRRPCGPGGGVVTVPARVLFVGPVTSPQTGGATVKNGLLVAALRERGARVEVVDTGPHGAAARLRQLAALVRALTRHDQVLLSVSRNGAVLLVALLALASAVRPRLRCSFLAVGSSLPGTVGRLHGAARRLYLRCLSRCRPVWVEGEWMRRELEALGAGGVEVLPNPRPPAAERWDPASVAAGRLVFVSRVTPEKGVERAMAAVEAVAASGVEASL